jgi:hypothetical protein
MPLMVKRSPEGTTACAKRTFLPNRPYAEGAPQAATAAEVHFLRLLD